MATTHNHVMELGGNVPDSSIEYDLLGKGTSAETTDTLGVNDDKTKMVSN